MPSLASKDIGQLWEVRIPFLLFSFVNLSGLQISHPPSLFFVPLHNQSQNQPILILFMLVEMGQGGGWTRQGAMCVSLSDDGTVTLIIWIWYKNVLTSFYLSMLSVEFHCFKGRSGFVSEGGMVAIVKIRAEIAGEWLYFDSMPRKLYLMPFIPLSGNRHSLSSAQQ